jgi:hypothetical protein
MANEENRRSRAALETEDLLDQVTGTEAEQQAFLEMMKEYYFDCAEGAYHSFVKEAYVIVFLAACVEEKIFWSRFSCSCETESGKPHQHFIISIKNCNWKQPTDKLTRTMREIMKANGLEMVNGDKIMCRNKKIRDGVHLVNTALYIQSCDTSFDNHDNHDRHFDHRFTSVIFPNRKVMLAFREHRLDPFLPEYEEERERLFQAWRKKNEKDHPLPSEKSDMLAEDEEEKLYEAEESIHF